MLRKNYTTTNLVEPYNSHKNERKKSAFIGSLCILVLILILFNLKSYSQTDSVFTGRSRPTKKEKPKKITNNEWKKTLTYDFNFQAWAGNPTFILLSPSLGYNVSTKLNLGFGLIYNYTNKDFGKYGKYNGSSFGLHSHARYIFGDNFFTVLQYDKLLQPNILTRYPNVKTWVDYLMLGAGYRQNKKKSASFNSSLVYNLLPDILSIYPSRIIVQIGLSGVFN